VYQALQLLGIPFIFIYLLFRKFYQNKQAVFTLQRFGFVPVAPPDKKIIWLHAVSVGEMLSLEYFITLIKKEIPNSFCYLTVGTNAAKNLALKNIRADSISFIPYDFLPCMLLAYHRIKPHSLVIVEAEIWPNLLMLAHMHKTKLYGLNARINDRSKTNTKIYRGIYRMLLNCFDTIFVQSHIDEKKFQDLKISSEKIVVLGNLKAYNVAIKKAECKASLEEKTFDNRALLAGSIHPGELNYYIELFKELKPLYPDLKLILAPRHFTWKADLEKSLFNQNFNFIIWDAQHPLPAKQTLNQQLAEVFIKHDILVICVLGELFKLYNYADIFFLGGTFVPIGGHNLLEPAVWGTPMIVGPMHWGCQEHADALEQTQALLKVSNNQELIQQTKILLQNKSLLNTMHINGQQWLNIQADNVIEILDQIIIQLKL